MTVLERAPGRSRARSSGAVIRAVVLGALVVGVDQLTKRTVAAGIGPYEREKILPFLHLVHVRNTGVAFGFLSGGGGVVLACTLLALAALVFYFARHPARPGLWVPTGLLIGGAVGNLIDRLLNGYVTDFIKLPHWPAFNVADIAITLGVVALVFVLEWGAARSR